MYCSECGKKIKDNSTFCGECGAKVKKAKFDFKNNKIIICIIALVVVLLGLFITFSNITSPKHITNKYLKATINKDSNALYGLLDLSGDKTFISKNVFKKLVLNNAKDSNIENFKIKDITYSSGKLSAKVLFTYTLKNNGGERTRYIELNKSKDKKFIFFDKWIIRGFDSSSIIVNDYKILVPKDTKVIYGGVNVSHKYLDKENSNDKIDVYKLPQVFRTKTDVEATLSNGLKVKESVTPNFIFKQYQLKLTSRNISSEDSKKIESVAKDNIDLIYKSAIENKTFNDIKSNYKAKDLTNLEKSYSNFSKSLNDKSNKLKNITFNDVELSSVSLNSDGFLNVLVKVKSKYTVEYKLGSEVKESTNNTTNYYTLVYSLENKKYDLVNIVNFQTYFFR